MAEAEKPAFPLRMKLGLLAAVLATTPLPVVGFVLIGVAQGAIEHQSRELQLAALVLDGALRDADEHEAHHGERRRREHRREQPQLHPERERGLLCLSHGTLR